MGKNIGIWRYDRYYPKLEDKYRLSLAEGSTPLIKIDDIYFKREDLNPTGSVKDRGLAFQVSWAYSRDFRKFAISSSGNAAISAANYINLIPKGELRAFVGKEVNRTKLSVLRSIPHVSVEVSRQPNTECFRYAKRENAYNLRPSMDPNGLIGFISLGLEVGEELPMVSSIFMAVSSGTTLLGMSRGLGLLRSTPKIFPKILPRIFPIQPASFCPIASFWDKDFRPEKEKLTDAIVARSIPRKEKIIEKVNSFGGQGLVVSNKEIKKSWQWLKKRQIETSYEGGMTLAGLRKALEKRFRIGKYPLVILTGKYYD